MIYMVVIGALTLLAWVSRRASSLYRRAVCHPQRFCCGRKSGGNRLTVCRMKLQKYDHVTHLLRDLHWLRVPERIQFRLAVLIIRCRNNTTRPYLLRGLQWTDETESLRGLRPSSQQRLIVPRM